MPGHVRVALNLLLAGVLWLLTTFAGMAESLKVGGAGGALGTMRQVSALFVTATGVSLEIVPSLGSGGGLRAVRDGMLDLAISARPLTEKESTAGLRMVFSTRTPFVFVTSWNKPRSLTRSEIAHMFAGPEVAWDETHPVRAILRPPLESDYAVLFAEFPGTETAVAALRRRGDVPVAPTDQDNLDLAERLPGSFVTTTLAQLRTENRALWIVPIDGVVPDLDALQDGRYPFAKTFHFVVSPRSDARVTKLISYLRSPEGRVALRQAGNLQ